MGDCFSTATIAQKKRGASRDSHLSISVGPSINPFATFRSASAYIPENNWAPALNPDSACPYLPLCFVRGQQQHIPTPDPSGNERSHLGRAPQNSNLAERMHTSCQHLYL